MGLISAALGAAGGVLADQWREYFYCSSLEENVLVCKGEKRQTSRGKNTKGSDNIITNGSIIAVNEGQCMMIVQQGAIVEFCGEAGEFVWDSSTEPTVLYGGFGKGLVNSFKTFGKRFTMGGEPGTDQRVYFFNTKEIYGNKYGTPAPVPFRVVEKDIGLDMPVSVMCNGEYSYKLVDPILFYKNVCGNVEEPFKRDRIDSQMRTDFMTALLPAFGKLSELGISYTALPYHTKEIREAINTELDADWSMRRGIAVESVGINSIKASDEDEKKIKSLKESAVFRDPTMAAAHLAKAQAEAMVGAANNTSAGPVMAFAGMNMAQGAGGMNAQSLYQMGAQQQQQQQAATTAGGAAAGWTCSCGTVNTGKFCSNCGKPNETGWTCECGSVNKGKFCSNCGKGKPAGVPQYKCDKCGWEPEDPKNPPKFCPECGDPFGDEDIKK